VLRDIDRLGGAKEIWCLGDIVGYGPDPRECISLVRELCSVCVTGNHDWVATSKVDTSAFNPEATEAILWTRQQLGSEETEFLDSLPLISERGNFTLAHGSPRDPIWEYILTSLEAKENLNYFRTRYCLIGHSHLPLLYECARSCLMRRLSTGTTFRGVVHAGAGDTHTDFQTVRLGLEEKRFIINPGSVGQPRDKDARAAYALYNSENNTIDFCRVKYDISATQQRMEKARLPNWLIGRLERGE